MDEGSHCGCSELFLSQQVEYVRTTAMGSLIHLLPLRCDFLKTETLSDLSEGRTNIQLLFNMYLLDFRLSKYEQEWSLTFSSFVF